MSLNENKDRAKIVTTIEIILLKIGKTTVKDALCQTT